MTRLIDDAGYLPAIVQMLEKIEKTQLDAITATARSAFESIRAGGVLHVFSTGHSHMIVEEMFYRAGGLAPISPLLDDRLMLHTGAITSTKLERTPGLAAQVLSQFDLRAGDSAIVSSNSGINAVPVEAAMHLKALGITVTAVTSVQASRQLEPRHPDGLRLLDVADIVIDNCAPMGDGLLEIPGFGQVTGGASTFGSLFIAQRIVLAIENLFLAQGQRPPVFTSANIPGGDQANKQLIEQYKTRIRSLE